jgi:hypothetical protein
MKNVVKSSFYTLAWLILISLNTVSAIDVGTVDGRIRTADSADVVIQNWLSNLLTFLYLAAVLIAIWWGFNILTAAWDEEKVKKGKTILIQAMGWIVVIFLAGSIIQWLLGIVQ